jgi:hypothetical protein
VSRAVVAHHHDDSLPMFSPLSVGLASSRVPVPDTP